jgi:hypothetical protein
MPLRVGLLTDGTELDGESAALAEWALGRQELELLHLPASGRRPPRPRALLDALEAPLLRGRPYASSAASRGLGARLPPACPPADAASLGLDLLLDLGERPLGRGLLRAARLGVLRVWHGGFAEAASGAAATAFDVHRVSDEQGRRDLLAAGTYRTRWHYAYNRAHVRLKAFERLRSVLAAAAEGGRLPSVVGRAGPEPEDAPGAGEAAAYLGSLACRLALRALRRLARVEDHFEVALQPSAAFALGPGACGLSAPRGRMWADPFLLRHGGSTVCFVEDLVYATGRAHITALELEGNGARELGAALREPFHLSFPFVFRSAGELYMCPEASSSGRLTLYRCAEFPLKWVPAATLLEAAAADPLLFERGGRWWLLANVDRSGTRDHDAELHAFWSDDLLSGRWTPHPLNPVKTDAMGGRNAGLLEEGGRLLRLGQLPAFDRYGRGVRAFEIVELSETAYREEERSELAPPPGWAGVHHFSRDGGVSAYDRHAWSWLPLRPAP